MRSPIRRVLIAAGVAAATLVWLALLLFALEAGSVLLLATAIAVLLWTVVRVAQRAVDGVRDRRRSARLAALAKQACADDVRFALRRPAYVEPDTWSPLLVQAYRAEHPSGERPAQDPSHAANEHAERLLGTDAARAFVTATEDSIAPVPHDARLRFVPDVPGCRFNPPVAIADWSEAVLSVLFRMKADPALDGDTARGRISIFCGPLLLAEMAVVVRVTSEPQPAFAPSAETVHAAAYRRVFACYAHTDEPIVRQMEIIARAFGDDFMRDVTTLRSGEEWSPRIAELIEEADVFQLFWSSHAMRSEYVAREWRHALSLGREHFIRPIYWEQPLPEQPDRGLPPPELKRIHFQRLPLEAMGVRRRGGMMAAGSTAAAAMIAGLVVTMQVGMPAPESMASYPDVLTEAPSVDEPPRAGDGAPPPGADDAPPRGGIAVGASPGQLGSGPPRPRPRQADPAPARPVAERPPPAVAAPTMPVEAPRDTAVTLPARDVLRIVAVRTAAGDAALDTVARRLSAALAAAQQPVAPGGDAAAPWTLSSEVARLGDAYAVALILRSADGAVVWQERIRGDDAEALERSVLRAVAAATRDLAR